MRTKVIYILSSDESDIYLEQTLLSLYSLRKHNKDANVELVVDQQTDESLIGKREEVKRYISEKIVVQVPEKYNKVERSRWIKTSLRRHVHGTFLFIDSDTIITGDLSTIDDYEGEVGAVPDGHVNMGCTPYNYSLRSLSKEDGWSFSETLPYYNSGVLFVRDSEIATKLYEGWHLRWTKGVENHKHVSDQSYLAASNESLGYVIKPLDGIWNCQIVRNGLPFLTDAKIIHYLGFNFHSQCPHWAFYDKGIYMEIKENGCISERTSRLVDDAKKAFPETNNIVSNREAVITRSRLFRFLLKNMWLVTGYENLTKLLRH